MKKTIITLMAMSTVLMADNTNKRPCERQVEAIDVRKLDPQTLNELMEGKHPFISIEFKKGDQFPLSLFLKGDFVELVGEEDHLIYIKANKDIYLRQDGESFLFSSNNTDWKPIVDFITGTAAVGFGVDEEENIEVRLGAEAYERN